MPATRCGCPWPTGREPMGDQDTEGARRAWVARQRALSPAPQPAPWAPPPPAPLPPVIAPQAPARPVVPRPPAYAPAPAAPLAPHVSRPSAASVNWQRTDGWLRRRATTGIIVGAHFLLLVD